MAITTTGWVDWAERKPGIGDKIYSEPNRGLGLIGHSIVGSAAAAYSRFLSTAKDASGNYTAQAAASCMFILEKSGELVQMYPVTASTWTSGGREANTSYWPIEAEGGAPGNEREPLTDAQVRTLLRLCAEFEKHTGRKVQRGTTFREHGEVATKFGYSPTACPSGRYARFYEALEAGPEVEMALDTATEARIARLERIVGGVAATDIDLLASVNGLNDALTRHAEEHPGVPSVTVAPHAHVIELGQTGGVKQ